MDWWIRDAVCFEPSEEGDCDSCGEFGDLDGGLCEECFSEPTDIGTPYGWDA